MNLASYDAIIINTSAGKDSQAMMDHVVALARAQGVLDRVRAVHCDLKRVEWPGTRELALAQCEFYGIPCEIVTRIQGDLLTHIRQRGMWPSSAARYCTSDHKRAQVHRVFTSINVDGRRARILNCMGFRRDESPARAKKQAFTESVRPSNGRRQVDEWLPILDWSIDKVWDTIRSSGSPHHQAYDLGMPRLSCVFCVLAPRAALVVAGRHNPELLDEYVKLETDIGHRFQNKYPSQT